MSSAHRHTTQIASYSGKHPLMALLRHSIHVRLLVWRCPALGIVAMLLCGCVASNGPDHPPTTAKNFLTLQASKSAGQTFVARQGGLNGVEVMLRPSKDQAADKGYIRVHLRVDAQATSDLAVATLPITNVKHTTFYHFGFPTQSDSRQHDYYALFEVVGQGSVLFGSAKADTYNDGALYRYGLPDDNQLVFRPQYALWFGIVDTGARVGSGLYTLLLGAFLFVLPGWALLILVWPGGTQLAWSDKIGLAGGLSLALYPLLLLWTNLVGVQAGALYAYVPGAIALAALVWHHRGWRLAQGRSAANEWWHSPECWPDLALVILIALILGVRLAMIEPLDVPLWGDSYQHTMIAQLIVDHGGLFRSWRPYVPYESLTVQYGFSNAVALWSWMTSASIAPATLVVGQLINALAVVSLYPLTRQVTGGNRWAGVGAVLIAGLVSSLPLMYINWGRYAQLGGQAILPTALWLSCVAIDGAVLTRRALLRRAVIAGATVAGMVLTYYRMPFYYGTFLVGWLVGWALPRWRRDWRQWLRGGAVLALTGAAAGALALPWYFFVAGGKLASTVGAGVSGGGSASVQAVSQLDTIIADYATWRNVTDYVSLTLLLFCVAALLLSVYRRQWPLTAIALWVAGMALIVLGRLVRLPGANLMQNFAIIIALYLPVGVLVGALLGEIATFFERYAGRLGSIAVVLSLCAAGVWACASQQTIISGDAIIVTRPDLHAMQWIKAHTPADARFLVEGYRIYNGTSAVGADGGWWMPLLAGRANTMPPQYALLNERASPPEYTQQVIDMIAKLEKTKISSPEGIQLLCANNISHVYIGQSQGVTGFQSRQLFREADLRKQTRFHQIYAQDRVRVYEFDRSACGAAQ